MAFQCDPFGIFCFLFLYSLIAYVDYVYIIYVLPFETISKTLYYILIGCIQLLLFMLIWSHLMCLISDPGIVYTKNKLSNPNQLLEPPQTSVEIDCNNQPPANPSTFKRNFILEEEWTFCKSCHIYRPPRAHHCQICRRCILKMDHHCPWINNCVGELNQKYFLQFTSYACLISVLTVVAIVISITQAQENTPIKIIHVALLIMASIIFGLFSIAVLSDQLQSIFKDQTTIERVRGQRGPKKSRMKMLRQTCGSLPMILWGFPIPCGRILGTDENEINVLKNNHLCDL